MRLLSLVVAGLLTAVPGHAADIASDAFDKPMVFVVAASGGNCGDCEWIAAIGIIEADTPAKFEAFLAANRYIPGTVVLHSPGGNLLAGLQLGTIIRNNNLATTIGNTISSQDSLEYDGTPHYSEYFEAGRCASACAYAFLGGVSRDLGRMLGEGTSSHIAFHQFAQPRTENHQLTGATGVAQGQEVSGIIAAYLGAMGVDGRVLTMAGLTPSEDLYEPKREELIAYRIVTVTGFGPWQLDSFAGTVAATTTAADTYYSDEKQVIVYCQLPKRLPVIAVALEGPPFVISTGADDASRLPTPAEALEMVNDVKVTFGAQTGNLDKQGLAFQIQSMDRPSYVYMGIPTAWVPGLLTAATLAIDIGGPHVFSDFGIQAKVTIDAAGHDKLRLALRDCL